MAVPEHRTLLERLSGLVAEAKTPQDTDLQAIVSVVQEIRAAIAPTGVLYATRAEAARQRQMNALFSETSRHLNDYYYNGKDIAHLHEALGKMRAACTLEETVNETIPEDGKQAAGGLRPYEILGNLLIVGFW